jgi:hypothetical protein
MRFLREPKDGDQRWLPFLLVVHWTVWLVSGAIWPVRACLLVSRLVRRDA